MTDPLPVKERNASFYSSNAPLLFHLSMTLFQQYPEKYWIFLNFCLQAISYLSLAPRKFLLSSSIFQLFWQDPLAFAMPSAEILMPGKHCQGHSTASETCSAWNKLVTEHTYQYLLQLLRQNVKHRLYPSAECSQTIAITPRPGTQNLQPL